MMSYVHLCCCKQLATEKEALLCWPASSGLLCVIILSARWCAMLLTYITYFEVYNNTYQYDIHDIIAVPQDSRNSSDSSGSYNAANPTSYIGKVENLSIRTTRLMCVFNVTLFDVSTKILLRPR